jgi:hypothetical protein
MIAEKGEKDQFSRVVVNDESPVTEYVLPLPAIVEQREAEEPAAKPDVPANAENLFLILALRNRNQLMLMLSKRLNQLFPSSKLAWLLLSLSQNLRSKQMSMFLVQSQNP